MGRAFNRNDFVKKTTKVTEGKKFEDNFKNSIVEDVDIIVDRIRDVVDMKKGLHNIADFLVNYKGQQYYVELKHRKDRLNLADISQIERWHEIYLTGNKYLKVCCIIRFSELNYRAFYVPYSILYENLIAKGIKSVNKAFLLEHGKELVGELKRVNYTYKVKELLEEVSNG